MSTTLRSSKPARGFSRLPHDLGLAHALDERPLHPTLRQASRHLIVPPTGVDSLWPRVRNRLRQLEIEFDPFQAGLSAAALSLDDEALFTATVGGVTISIPRQVGKTFWLSRILFALCLEFPGLQAIWTSHHGRTTTQTFRGVAGMTRLPAIRPFMASGPTRGVRTGAGIQEIAFANGSRIQFGARESGFGRGMDAIDVLIFDEAQILGLKALEDMVPATNAAKATPHGGLVFYIGTPPRPADDGEAFRAKRRAALTGRARNSVYVEISGDPVLGPHDPRNYLIANPSYPSRVPLQAMQRMAENIPDERSWCREALGIWDEIAERERVLPGWDDLAASGPAAKVRPVAFGVDRSLTDGVSIVAAWHMGAENLHVEEVWRGPSMEEAADYLAKTSRVRDLIFVDAKSPAVAIGPLLQARKRKVLRASTAEYVSACALIEEAVLTGQLSHNGNSEMAAAVKAATRREIKGYGSVWDRPEDGAPCHNLIAASLAVLGARKQKPADPNRPTRASRGRATRSRGAAA